MLRAMSPRVTLVTGATDGIGKQTALMLARRGHYVIVHGRSLEKVQAVCDLLAREAPGVPVGACVADLALLDEVQDAARYLLEDNPVIDVVVNNAAVVQQTRSLTSQGWERTLMVNHLAPFALTHLLLPALRKSAQGRVVNVSSMAHRNGRIDLHDLHLARGAYEPYQAYANSKLANVLFTFELARRLKDTAITVNALHPGVIATKLLSDGLGFGGGGDVEKGARTSVMLADDPALAKVTGRYFENERESRVSDRAHDEALQRAFYEASAELVGVEPLPG